ncbi:hypothetical protein [Streptomyces sp. NPDC055749]
MTSVEDHCGVDLLPTREAGLAAWQTAHTAVGIWQPLVKPNGMMRLNASSHTEVETFSTE